MSDHLLLYIGVPFFRVQGTTLMERQAINGLRQWARHFDPITVLAIKYDREAPVGWVPIPPDLATRVRIEPLPEAWRPGDFVRALPGGRARIRRCLSEARYACFATGGMIGDWGSVAVLEAHAAGRRVAAHWDRIESTVLREDARNGMLRKRLKAAVELPLMERYERFIAARVHLGMLHGAETYETLRALPRHAANVHDIHLTKADHITADALAAKQHSATTGPLRIVYAGRIAPMKGWRDWVTVMADLAARNVNFSADWLGSGPEEDAMRADVAARGLGDRIRLHGHVDDRSLVRAALMGAHALVFCHKTKESPRILIEALTAGTPIVGYRGAFAADLIRHNTGGLLIPMDDVTALADAAATLIADRSRLADLMARAARDGAPFDDASVFAHRAGLIRRYL